MIETLTKIASSPFVISIIAALAIVLGAIFYVPQSLSVAIVTIIIYFLIFAFLIYKRLKTDYEEDVRGDSSGRKYHVLILYSEKENNAKNFVSNFTSQNAHSELQFRDLQIEDCDKGTAVIRLKEELTDTGLLGVYCFWNSEISEDKNYIEEVEKWLIKHESRPFVIISKVNEAARDRRLKQYQDRYCVLDITQATDALLVLLGRSIRRTNRFINGANTWKFAFFSSSVILTLVLVIFGIYNINPIRSGTSLGNKNLNSSFSTNSTFTEQPSTTEFRNFLSNLSNNKPGEQNSSQNGRSNLGEENSGDQNIGRQVKNFIHSYFLLKRSELINRIPDGTLHISLWRTYINEEPSGNTLHRITTTSNDNTTELSIRSIAGCAGVNEFFYGWWKSEKPGAAADSSPHPPEDVFIAWNIMGKTPSEIKQKAFCGQFQNVGNSKQAILCVGKKLSENELNVICIDSNESAAIVVHDTYNDIVKSYLIDLLTLTSIPPTIYLEKDTNKKLNEK